MKAQSNPGRRAAGVFALLLLALACDPNVVIGAKWREPALGTAGTNGGGAGSAQTGGVSAGGSADEPAGGGQAGDAAVAGAGGSGDAGETGIVYFEADHEGGSLAEWDEGSDLDAGGYYADAAPPTYTTDRAHSGKGAARVTIDTAGGDTIARLYRRVEADQAYYSAWFYLAEDHSPSQWWSIFLFRAGQDRSKSIDLWDIDLIRVGGNQLSMSIYDHQRNQSISVPSRPIIPIAKWFQLEAFLAVAPGEPSRLTFWLDGQQFLALDDLDEAPAGQAIYWVIGNGGSTLSPPVSTLYVDDAVVSATRTGP